MAGFCQDMSSDYHDVPHCIRNALASSPAPSHFSRISDSSPEPHQEGELGKELLCSGMCLLLWFRSYFKDKKKGNMEISRT